MDARDRWEGLVRAVDWTSLSGYPRNGSPLEPLLLRLWDAGTERGELADRYRELRDLVVHQGTTFETSAVVARLLIAFVGEPDSPGRDLACWLLSEVAVGDQANWLFSEWTITDRREALAAQLAKTAQPWEPWTVASEQTMLAVYDAVRAGVPTYVLLLDSEDLRIPLRASALLGWFPENAQESVPPLTALVEQSANPWIKGTAAVALGLLAGPDDPAVEQLLRAVWSGGSAPERWSGCIALAEMLSEPSDEIVNQLHACMWETADQTYPWGFLDGDISTFASSTITALPRSTALAQVNALIPRLGSPDPFDLHTVVKMLLAAAVGDDVRSPASLNSRELPEAQAAAFRAIAETLRSGDLLDDESLLQLVRVYGIPASNLVEFVKWATAVPAASG